MAKNNEYTYLDDRHPHKDIYSVIPNDKWLSKREIGKKFREELGFKVTSRQLDAALSWSRQYGIVEHRIRAIKPLKGFTAEDVLKKITHGASKVNTGVLVYEYRITGKDPREDFERLVIRSRNNRHGKKKKPVTWSKKRMFTPEEAMYIKMNPDNMSDYMTGKMFGVDKRTISEIRKGNSYKNLDLAKYMPIREEIFNQIKTERYDFFVENKI